jgi:hypothetical protein
MIGNIADDSNSRLKSELDLLIQSGSSMSSLSQDYFKYFKKKFSDEFPGVKLSKKILLELFPTLQIRNNNEKIISVLLSDLSLKFVGGTNSDRISFPFV